MNYNVNNSYKTNITKNIRIILINKNYNCNDKMNDDNKNYHYRIN